MDSAPILSLHSLQSRSFTSRESMRITQLYLGIVSLPLPQRLLSAYAILPPARSGAGVVAVQPDSGSTLVVITPYGMLLLSFEDELDASSAASLTSFIKKHTEGARDTMTAVSDNPISADEVNRLGELEDTEKLLYALREVAETSEDAESVRVAFIALYSTELGKNYMRENQIRL